MTSITNVSNVSNSSLDLPKWMIIEPVYFDDEWIKVNLVCIDYCVAENEALIVEEGVILGTLLVKFGITSAPDEYPIKDEAKPTKHPVYLDHYENYVTQGMVLVDSEKEKETKRIMQKVLTRVLELLIEKKITTKNDNIYLDAGGDLFGKNMDGLINYYRSLGFFITAKDEKNYLKNGLGAYGVVSMCAKIRDVLLNGYNNASSI